MKRRLYFSIGLLTNSSGALQVWTGQGLFFSEDEARGAADRLSRLAHPGYTLHKVWADVIPDDVIKDAARELEAA